MIPVSTDWLGVSIRLLDNVRRPVGGCEWKEFEGGTNVWRKRRVLYNRYGERVLTLLSSPKSEGFLDPQAALVEVSNEWLYHGIGANGALRLLSHSVPFDILGLSRLDLCCDFVPSIGLSEVISGLGSGSYYVSGKQNGSGFWSINQDEWMPEMWRGHRIPHCTSWGHKTSDVKWKLYYKSKELRDAMGGRCFDKPYIVDMWRECGLNINNVWRLEVSIKHCNKLTLDGQIIDFDTWYKNTLYLFRSLYRNRFTVRSNQGHQDKSNDAVVPFLPIEDAGVVRCKKCEGESGRSARIGLLRHLVKSLDEPEVFMDVPTRDEVVTTVHGIVTRDRLHRYFEAMVGETLVNWEARVTGNGEQGNFPLMRNVAVEHWQLPVNEMFSEQHKNRRIKRLRRARVT